MTGYRILLERNGDLRTVVPAEDCKLFGRAETIARLLSDIYRERVVVQEWRDGAIVDPEVLAIPAQSRP